MLYQLSYKVKSVRVGDISELHESSIPKVAGSIPIVVRQLFSLPGVDAHSGSLRVTSQTYLPEYITPDITPTHKKAPDLLNNQMVQTKHSYTQRS